ncbi:YopX family protein [Mammaliicoccus sciuri]|uniref:YopX family protein n=1 Tax=Mammaliicoccus sciuri TaxID=1296 RepID=UPI0021D3B509|nr:YopX family protein [Mammaliicoccus sciuri]UXU72932.1 YopX family protein [Mammaliicoccus sciuri]
MNRLRFRVWDKEEKKFVDYPVYFNLTNSEIVTELWYGYQIQVEEAIQDSNYIVQQSTGLFDKNGKEIFEGDIVTAMSEGIKGTGVVKRRIDGYWFMYPAWQNGQSWKLVVSEQGDTDVEIIGNKFEHPYLLGED